LLQLILLFFTIMISGVSHMQNKWGWTRGVLYFNILRTCYLDCFMFITK
jgi:hypothetical protein